MSLSATNRIKVEVSDDVPDYDAIIESCGSIGGGILAPSQLPVWPAILQEGLRHRPYWLSAKDDSHLAGYLLLCFVRSRLFGRFLVSLPYLNSAGVVATSDHAAAALVDRAVALADELDVRYLELRHERRIEHESLGSESTSKVHMRLRLPDSTDALWSQLKAKVRNQVRKGRERGFNVVLGSSRAARRVS